MQHPHLSFAEWRERARPLLVAGLDPPAATQAILERRGEFTADAPTHQLRFPAALMRLLESLSCFRTPGRYELMYRLAWRSLFENSQLLQDAADRDVRQASLMDAAIRRDVHKMHAFVRFREVPDEHAQAGYFAWFEPEHEILRRGAPFFVKRFPNMTWTIATPDGAAVWNQSSLKIIESPGPAARPLGDAHEGLWRIYYRSICNVARINPTAMQREMPQKYWKNLPEAAEIGLLVRDGLEGLAVRAPATENPGSIMAKAVQRALAHLPAPGDGPEACRRCDLWRHATQAVMGAGPKDARIMLVGEQPGDEEDLRGDPFVGPAGRELDRVMRHIALDRTRVFVTNAVKHFKWEPRGKRRLHKKPHLREIDACTVWLSQEITEIKPSVIVALGATALRALSGSSLSIEAARNQTLSHASGAALVATYHPSAILRADAERADVLRGMLAADLQRASRLSAAAGPL